MPPTDDVHSDFGSLATRSVGGWLLWALLGLISCIHVSSAHAAEAEEYKALTDAAIEEHSLGHYEEARALFARAHAIAPNARTFWGMGIAAFEARQYVDALQLLAQAREDARKPLTAAQRKQTESLVERCQAYVVRVPIRVQPSSAKVTVDGRDVDVGAEGVVMLDAGSHQVVVSARGYEEVVRTMRWEAGTAPALEILLEEKHSQIADAPPEPDVKAESTPQPAAAARPDGGSRSLSVLKWVSLTAAVAAVGVMGAGIALRESTVAYYNDDSKCPPPDPDLACPTKRAEVRRWETMAIVGGSAAGVFATLAVVFFVLDRRPPRNAARAGLRCGPMLGAGALCQGRF